MESFGAALDRLTKIFFSELFAAVQASALERLAEEQEQEKETRAKPTRTLSPSFADAVTQPVLVRQFDIPVGQPRRRRRRSAATTPRKPAAAPQQPPTFKFEVIPHPDRKNRRIVMTRVSST